MVTVWEHFVLQRQECAARIHQIHARQVVLFGDFLRTQVFFHRHRVIRAAFYRGIVGHNHTLLALNLAYACHHAS